MCKPALSSYMETADVSTLNRMFPEYSFLRSVPEEARYCESFWCVHKDTNIHYKIRVFGFDPQNHEFCRQHAEVVKKVAKVSHPNLIGLKDAWIVQDKYYVVQSFDKSETLERAITDSRLGVKSFFLLGIQFFECLQEIHSRGVCHMKLSPSSVYVDQAFLRVSPLTLHDFMQKGKYLLPAVPCPYTMESGAGEQADVFAALGCLLFMHTGHPPGSLDLGLWESYALEVDFMSYCTRMREQAQGAQEKVTAKQVLKDLNKLRETHCPETRPKNKLLTKLFRVKATRRVAKPKLQQPRQFFGEEAKSVSLESEQGPEPGAMIGQRYEVLRCLRREPFLNVCSAKDSSVSDRLVEVELYRENSDLNWANRFQSITTQLSTLSHPNIYPVLDAGMHGREGYLVRFCQTGEGLDFFAKWHHFDFMSLFQFSLQMLDALIYADSEGFESLTLSEETIQVFGASGSSYIYQTSAVGRHKLRTMSEGFDESVKAIQKPHTLAPELFQLQPQGQRTVQFILGNIILKLALGSHPCQDMSLVQAHHHTFRI